MIPKIIKLIASTLLLAYGVYQIEAQGKSLFEKIEGNTNAILGMPIIPVTNFFNRQPK